MCVNNVSNKCVEGMLSLIEQERYKFGYFQYLL